MAKRVDPFWYKKGWSLQISELSWVEQTNKEVELIIQELSLSGGERILDLGYGYGRHSLECARRGYDVVGVDNRRGFTNERSMKNF